MSSLPIGVYPTHQPPVTRRPRCSRRILKASEPATLLFKDLPTALDLQPFGPQKPSKVSPERTQEFVIRLKAALEELKIAYPLLRDRIRRRKITVAFEAGKSPSSFQASRYFLSQRCEALLINIRDMDFKAFCLRLLDNQLPEPELESVGSYVSNTPPVRWKDEDETAFEVSSNPWSKSYSGSKA